MPGESEDRACTCTCELIQRLGWRGREDVFPCPLRCPERGRDSVSSLVIRERLNGREEIKLVIPGQSLLQATGQAAQTLGKPTLPWSELTLVLGALSAPPSPSFSCPSPQALQRQRWSGGRGQQPITSPTALGICTWSNQSPLNNSSLSPCSLLPSLLCPATAEGRFKEEWEEALQTPSPWQQWSWAPGLLYRGRLKQYLQFLEPRHNVPRGPQGCASPALMDGNSYITEILLLGALGHRPF